MCGRFTLHARLNLILQQFAVEAGPEWAPRYNVAPTQAAPVIRQSESGRQELALLRWGLVPSWARDASVGSGMINARAETVVTKPSFRAAIKRRRCLVPADGYYEWQTIPGQRTKQPYLIRRRDRRLLAFAGIWESWHADQPDGIETFSIVTTAAVGAMQTLHDRQPLMFELHDYGRWLDPQITTAEPLAELLAPADIEPLEWIKVGTQVNNPRHDDPTCIEPLTAS